jgi:hypothetical protein
MLPDVSVTKNVSAGRPYSVVVILEKFVTANLIGIGSCGRDRPPLE